MNGSLSANETAYVRNLFAIPDGLDNGDFMYYMADIFAGKIQYGNRRALCNILDSMPTSTTVTKLPVIKQIADQMGMTSFEGYDRRLLLNTTYDINKNMRQWTW